MANDKYIIRQQLIPKPSKRRGGGLIPKVIFLVAHDTGNPGSTASDNVRYYINSRNEQSASAHLFVDDKEIIECIPALTGSPEKAWHVIKNVEKDNLLFGANANDAAIGVEYCFGNNIDADKAYNKYVWVLARLCFTFDLDPSRCIVGHCFLDPQRKTDPVTGLLRSRRSYEQLRRDVSDEFRLFNGDTAPSEYSFTEQRGTVVTTVKLNLRGKPSSNSNLIQTLPVQSKLNYIGLVNDGEPVNGNPHWYKHENGYFFWSGGVKQE